MLQVEICSGDRRNPDRVQITNAAAVPDVGDVVRVMGGARQMVRERWFDYRDAGVIVWLWCEPEQERIDLEEAFMTVSERILDTLGEIQALLASQTSLLVEQSQHR